MGKSVNLFIRLTYMLEEKSISAVSQDTAIPYTTLYNFAKGNRNLPEKWENVLYNAYARETYSRLRKLGYDVATASIRRYTSPEQLHMYSLSGRQNQELYTLFNVQRKNRDKTLTLKEAMQDESWQYYFERIGNAIKRRQDYIEKHPEREFKYPDRD